MFDSFKQSLENTKDRIKSEERIRQEIGDDIDDVMRGEVVPEAKKNAPYKSGELEDSIHFAGGHWESDTYVAEVRAEAEHAAAIEKGAEPHEIWANNEPYLKFYWTREGVHFKGKMVHHPGNEAHHFLENAIDDTGTERALSSSVKETYEDSVEKGFGGK